MQQHIHCFLTYEYIGLRPFLDGLAQGPAKDLKTWFVDKDRMVWVDFEKGAFLKRCFERFLAIQVTPKVEL